MCISIVSDIDLARRFWVGPFFLKRRKTPTFPARNDLLLAEKDFVGGILADWEARSAIRNDVELVAELPLPKL
jgi:hypothetical protein